MPKPAGCQMKSKPLWMPRTRMFSSVLENRYAPVAKISASTITWYSTPRKALLRQDQERAFGGAGDMTGQGSSPDEPCFVVVYLTGGAYMKPPLLHRLLAPRGSLSADFGPTLRSKISP